MMGVQLLSQGSAAVARKVHTLQVAGSIPAPATISPTDAQCPVRSGSHARRDNPPRSRRAIDQFVRVPCRQRAGQSEGGLWK